MATTTTTTTISQRRPRIVLFGDSLTEFSFGGDFGGTTRFGWGSLLAQAFVRKADVYNRGYSGYTTTMALETALPTVFVDQTKSNNNSSSSQQEAPILFCTVFFGTNDATLPSRPNSDSGRQHVPLCTYVENLRRIIDAIRNQTTASIIILTPPPLDEVKWQNFLGLYPYYDRTNATTRDYGLAAQRLVATMSIEVNTNDTTKTKTTKKQHGGGGCYVLDTWELLEGDQGPDVFGQYLNHDGVHFNEHGNTKLYEGLMDVLTTIPDLQHCAPRSLEDEGPAWDELC